MEHRYSDEDLAEFKAVIEKKLATAQQQVERLEDQLKEANENSEDEFGTDMMDDSSMGSDANFTADMLMRQRNHAAMLEKALIRVNNKSYGICVITGELIDKRRLLAVPTTTKSLQAKMAKEQPLAPTRKEESKDDNDEEDEKPKKKREYKPQIITKIIKKPTAPVPDFSLISLDDDDDDDDNYDDDDLLGEGISGGDDDDDDELSSEASDEEFDFDQLPAED